MFVSDLISASMRLLGQLASGESPTSSELNDGLSALNLMLDGWNNQKLLLPCTYRYVFTLTPNKGTYTIGTEGSPDITTTRPIQIPRAGLIVVTTNPAAEYPIPVLTQREFAEIGLKSLANTLPLGLYYEPDYPLGTIALWPVPQAANQIALYLDEQLSQFASTSATVDLQPGYIQALKYNLAMEWAPEFEVTPPALVAEGAQNSLEWIKNQNVVLHMETLQSDAALRTNGRPFNWLIGY